MTAHLSQETNPYKTDDTPAPNLSIGSVNLDTEALPPVNLRLIADFSLPADAAEELLGSPDLTSRQHRLFLAALRSPAAWRRICRMALVSQLESDPARWSDDLFKGPNYDQVLDCILPELAPADRAYWIRLRDSEPEAVIFYLDPLFQEIRGSLVSVRLLDLDTGESVPAIFARQDA